MTTSPRTTLVASSGLETARAIACILSRIENAQQERSRVRRARQPRTAVCDVCGCLKLEYESCPGCRARVKEAG